MSGSRAAVRYAKAILSFALEQNKEVEVNNDMLLIASTINENRDLQVLLDNPVLKSDLKTGADFFTAGFFIFIVAAKIFFLVWPVGVWRG